MKVRNIEVSTDTFAHLWSVRLASEHAEDEIIRRLLKLGAYAASHESADATLSSAKLAAEEMGTRTLPKSVKWTDLLVWTLEQLGGEATLGEIYRVSREGRRSLGHKITTHHDASARECLESHCSDSRQGCRHLGAKVRWLSSNSRP
jgi:hypothetical protein